MCEYCKVQIYVKTKKIMKDLLAPVTYTEELRQKLEDKTGEMYLQLPNKFCPICGKKLGEEQ